MVHAIVHAEVWFFASSGALPMATKDHLAIDSPDSYRGTPFKYLISYTIRNPDHAPCLKASWWRTTKMRGGTIVLSRSHAIRGPEDIAQIERELERHFKRGVRLVRGRLYKNILVTGFSRFED